MILVTNYSRFPLAALLGASLALAGGCGAIGKDDLPDGSGEADALADDSQVRWDQAIEFGGTLARDPRLPAGNNFSYSQEYMLSLTRDVSLRIDAGETTSACPGGAGVSGVYFTLTSADGLFRVTTDPVARPTLPMPDYSFPGHVPEGTHVLTVTAYGSGACSVRRSFNIPAPGGDDGLPNQGEDAPIDQALVGTWEASGWMSGDPYTSTYVFSRDRRMSHELWLDGRLSKKWSGKYEVDPTGRPRRVRMTVTSVQTAGANGHPSIDDVERCIYYPEPAGAPVALTWECSDSGVEQFPTNFSVDAETYDRTAGGTGVEDFRIDKRADALSVAIPDDDDAGVRHKFSISGGGRVVDVGVDVGATHGHVGDLRVRLEHPDGTSIMLHEPTGAGGTWFRQSWGLLGTSVPDLAQLEGRDVDGVWFVVVSDETPGDTGTLSNVRLVISGVNQ